MYQAQRLGMEAELPSWQNDALNVTLLRLCSLRIGR